MRKNLKPKAYIYPLPVLIIGTYDESGTPNAMNAAWGTVCDTAQVSICLSATHKTVKNLLKTKAFTVAIADSKNVVPADYIGGNRAEYVFCKYEKIGRKTYDPRLYYFLAGGYRCACRGNRYGDCSLLKSATY